MIEHDLDFDAHRDHADQAEPVDLDRWPVLLALLADPAAEAARLTALLSAWPAAVRRHRIADDFPHRADLAHPPKD